MAQIRMVKRDPTTGHLSEIVSTDTVYGNAAPSSGSDLTNKTYTDGTFLQLVGGTLTGALLFSADNTYAIGAAVATRPSIVYAGTSMLAPLFNASTGFQIAGAATSGNYLRGNGTDFISSVIQESDLPSGGSDGQIQGNDAGTFNGVPGSTCDFTNGLISLAPTGTGVALSLTGDSAGDDILDLFVNGGGTPTFAIDGLGDITAVDAAGDSFSMSGGTVNLTNGDGDSINIFPASGIPHPGPGGIVLTDSSGDSITLSHDGFALTDASGDSISAHSGIIGFAAADGSSFSLNAFTGIFISSPANPISFVSPYAIQCQGSPVTFQPYTVATLPSEVTEAVPEGGQAYATDGLKVGEVTGSGTGVPVYYSGGNWRVYSTDMPVSN
jgi:hypothetical protein